MTEQEQATTAGVNGHNPVRITSQTIVARSPVSGAVLGQVSIATPLQIRTAMDEARVGFAAWEGIGLQRRLLFLDSLQASLYRHRDLVTSTLMAEQGKVHQETVLEFLATIEQIAFYRRAAASVLAPQVVPVRLIPQRKFVVERRPFGVTLVIAPWNYPLYLSLGPIAAALVAGNSVVYKPSEYATQIGEVMARVIAEAGIPPEVSHIVHGYGDVGAALIEAHPDNIVFTGSVPTGKKIAQAAAAKLIPVTLELGGKDAAIVLDDADIDYAAEGIVWSGMFNAGQTCASVERVFVLRAVADRLLVALQRTIERHIVSADGGPYRSLAAMTTPDQLAIVDAQVREAVEQGATVISGGYRLEKAGLFYAPTILSGVTPGMRISQEETFGPVLAVTVVEDDTEAIRRANHSAFGLTASVWTRNRSRGWRVARQLHVGSASINEHLIVSGAAEVPWGGVKESGYGRTQGKEGLLAVTYAKTINVDRFRLPFEPFWYPYNAIKRSLSLRAVDLLFGPTVRDKLRALLP